MENKNYRLERTRKRKQIRNKVLVVTFLTVFLVVGLILGRKVFIKRNVIVMANNITDYNKSIEEINLLENEEDLYNNNELIKSEYRKKSVKLLYPIIQKKNIVYSQEEYDKSIYSPDGKKVAYLTFDDGPTPNNTPRILDILNKKNVKATFFVIGNLAEKNKEILKREYNEGHAIGNHTYTHMIYGANNIYKDTSTFMQDLNKSSEVLKSILGNSYDPKLIRFPGGIFNNDTKKQPFVKAAIDGGYHYVNWNVLNGDAEGNGNHSSEKLISRFKETSVNKEHLVILMHDAAAKDTTVQALPEIIDYLQRQGYEFKTLY